VTEHHEAPLGQSAPADRAAVSGVAAADEAERRLAELDGAPLDKHVEVYEDAHRLLQEGLADLDER
jgi:hypothetical protein